MATSIRVIGLGIMLLFSIRASAQLPKPGESRQEIEKRLGAGEKILPRPNKVVYGDIVFAETKGTLFCQYIDDTLSQFGWSNVRPDWAIRAYRTNGIEKNDSMLLHCFGGDTWPVDSGRVASAVQELSKVYGQPEIGRHSGTPLVSWHERTPHASTLVSLDYVVGTIKVNGGRAPTTGRRR